MQAQCKGFSLPWVQYTSAPCRQRKLQWVCSAPAHHTGQDSDQCRGWGWRWGQGLTLTVLSIYYQPQCLFLLIKWNYNANIQTKRIHWRWIKGTVDALDQVIKFLHKLAWKMAMGMDITKDITLYVKAVEPYYQAGKLEKSGMCLSDRSQNWHALLAIWQMTITNSNVLMLYLCL